MKKFFIIAISIMMLCAVGFLTVGCNNTDTDEINVYSREPGSGTRSAFIELTGVEEKDADGNKVDKTFSGAAITDKTNVMLSSVSGDKRGIGYVSLGSLNDSVKAVSVAGVVASAATVKDGTYKLARPFNVAYKADNAKDTLADFIIYLASAQAQEIIGDNGYVSVKDNAPQYVAPETAPSASIVIGGSSSVSPLMEKLIENYCSLSGVAIAKIELQTLDSTAGMTNAISGTYDLGMASRALKENEAAQLESFVLAQDGIAVIVHKDSALDNLTIEQIRQIFTGEIRNWADVA